MTPKNNDTSKFINKFIEIDTVTLHIPSIVSYLLLHDKDFTPNFDVACFVVYKKEKEATYYQK